MHRFLQLLAVPAVLGICLISKIQADEPITQALWAEGQVPGLAVGEAEEILETIDDRIGRRVTKVTKPQIAVYAPPKDTNTGAAVVICPGGGYHILAYDLEGVEVAKWLNGFGVTGVVLHYRVPRAKQGVVYEKPLMDAQRAIRTVRAQADKWHIDPHKIGVLGFSAGGNLAAVTSNADAEGDPSADDPIERVSARPDFTLLIYPAYLNPEDNDAGLTPQTAVDEQTPPAFLVHTGDDRVPSTGSLAYYLALKRQGIPAELHIFPTGGHGYGLRPTDERVTAWPQLAEGWLRQQVLKPQKED